MSYSLRLIRVGILFLCGMLFYLQSHAQAPGLKPDPAYPKNAIHVSAGIGPIYGAAQGSYERFLYMSQKKRLKHVSLRATYGKYVLWADNGDNYAIYMSWIWGDRRGHLETALGTALSFDKSSYDIGVGNAGYFQEAKPSRTEYMWLLPAFTVGYRFQNPGGHFIFRTGIGWPEGVYLGLGLAF